MRSIVRRCVIDRDAGAASARNRAPKDTLSIRSSESVTPPDSGFGREPKQDYGLGAALLSQAMNGHAVNVRYTREAGI